MQWTVSKQTVETSDSFLILDNKLYSNFNFPLSVVECYKTHKTAVNVWYETNLITFGVISNDLLANLFNVLDKFSTVTQMTKQMKA